MIHDTARLLRMSVGADDRCQGQRLYETIVTRARATDLAGALGGDPTLEFPGHSMTSAGGECGPRPALMELPKADPDGGFEMRIAEALHEESHRYSIDFIAGLADSEIVQPHRANAVRRHAAQINTVQRPCRLGPVRPCQERERSCPEPGRRQDLARSEERERSCPEPGAPVKTLPGAQGAGAILPGAWGAARPC